MKLIANISQSLEHFFVIAARVFSSFVHFIWMALPIHVLITKRVVGKQLYSFCNNTKVRIVISLTTSFDNKLHKNFESFRRDVLIEAIYFRAYGSQFQVKNSKGVRIVLLVSSKLEIIIRRCWDNNTFFSVYSCHNGPISCLSTSLLLKKGGKFPNCSLRCSKKLISQCT